LCRWDFTGNSWITHESYVFSHFYLMKNVPMHAFEKKAAPWRSRLVVEFEMRFKRG
jgi:hypothetical protein